MKSLLTSLLVLASVGLHAAETPPFSPAVAAQFQAYIDKHTAAGAVALAADKDKIVSLTAVGYEDIAAQKPMAPNSMFWLASMTKPFTATAFMMLVDEGKVSVDDPVEKYLPEFKGIVVAPAKGAPAPTPAQHPVLIRQVLSHTSGLGFRSKAEAKGLDCIPLDEATKSYGTSWLGFEPGTAYAYSNEGFNVVARLIEVIGGEPYEKFMDERLFQPLGMTDTTFWPNDEQIARLAKTYAPGPVVNGAASLIEKPWTGLLNYPLSDRKTRFPMGGGGLFSTATDVSKFGRMILNGGTLDGKQYLSAATIALMTQDQTGALQKKYGFGWGDLDPQHFGHRGLSNTCLTIYPKAGLVAVFLAQQNGAFPWNMHVDFEKTSLKEIQVPPPHP